MFLVLVRLASGAGARDGPPPEVVVDILWATAVPEDLLEHVRARPGPSPSAVDVALFVNSLSAGSALDLALILCDRALKASPVLSGWTATPLQPISSSTTWETS